MPPLTATKLVDVCDDCLNIAYDNGFRTYDEQAAVMRDIGDQVEDHECIAFMEEDLECGCACNG